MQQLSLVSNPQVYALVDDDDYPDVARFTWYLRDYKGYKSIVRQAVGGGRYHLRTSHVLLNRYILGIDEPSIKVGHKDGDQLNCQKSNLFVSIDGWAVRRLRWFWLKNTEVIFRFPR